MIFIGRNTHQKALLHLHGPPSDHLKRWPCIAANGSAHEAWVARATLPFAQRKWQMFSEVLQQSFTAELKFQFGSDSPLGMRGFLEPNSVAVIGASSDPSKDGYAIVSNLKEKFSERLYPVNPRSQEVSGVQCSRSIWDLPESVELAIVLERSDLVPEVLERCGAKGIRRVMILGAGFAETGKKGIALQRRCMEIANRSKMRLWGPNCIGVVDGRSGMVASFMHKESWKQWLRGGDVSLIVQSGILAAGFIMQIIQEGYFGLSKACSIGDRWDVNECDLLEYFRDDPDTQVVAMYLESISDVKRFRKAILSLRKPVLLLKGGISSLGVDAARTHTAPPQEVAISEGYFRQLGIHRAFDFLELADLTKAIAMWRGKKGGRGIGVATFSGAAATVATDHLIKEGLSVPLLSEQSKKVLASIFPSWAEFENPVDLWPAIELKGNVNAYRTCLTVLMSDPAVDAIFVHVYVDSANLDECTEIIRTISSTNKPAALWVIGDSNYFSALRERLEPMCVPLFFEIQRAAKAIGIKAFFDNSLGA